MSVLKAIGYILLTILLILLVLAGGVILFLRFYPSVGKLPSEEEQIGLDKKTKRHFDGQFHNENEVSPMTGERSLSSDRKKPQELIPAKTPAFLVEPKAEELTFTWFGHSSFLLQIGGKNVLVDPVLSDRCSPVSFAGPKRFSQLPLTASELPKIDVVLLSHDHYDHLDFQTIYGIREQVGVFVVPLGVDSILQSWDVPAEKIQAFDWWESIELDGLRITLTPSQHFSGRNPLHRNATLWGGMYLQSEAHSVYYTGDGGYYDVFSAIQERLGAPDLMIGECGQYDPAWANIHMTPEQTVQAGMDVGAAWLIPVHWGSFCICNHAWDDSIRRVTAAAEASGLPIATPQIGETVTFDEIASFTDRWWESCE